MGTQLFFLDSHMSTGYRVAMPRHARQAPGGFVYHVLNRAVARLPLFQKDGDFDAFERILGEALHEHPTRLLAYCVMPNHWHLVLWPERDDELSAFVRWLTHTHAMRWHTHYHTAGTGHVYQGRFKAFPIAIDEHLYSVVRYVERNALRANLVRRAEDWRWCSLGRDTVGDGEWIGRLHPWPVPRPTDWLRLVNEAQTEAELAALRRAVSRGNPYGPRAWCMDTARQMGLEATLRPRGRPRKAKPISADHLGDQIVF
jgi:putative transposase